MIEIVRLDFAPVVRIAATATDVSDEALASTLDDLRRSLEQDCALGRPVLSIVDLTHARPLNAKQRTIMASWFKDIRHLTQQGSLGVFFLAPNAVVRGVLTAIFWFQTFSAPHAVGANLAEAMDFCVARLSTTGLHVDDVLAARIERALRR